MLTEKATLVPLYHDVVFLSVFATSGFTGNKFVVEAIKTSTTLTGVAQWTECWPANQRVPSSIPSQGTCLGCIPGPQ